MCKKFIYLISFVLALGLAGDVQVATAIDWTGTIDNDWFTAGNWDLERLPTSDDVASISLEPGPTIASGDAVGKTVRLVGTGGGTGALTMDSGTLTISSGVAVGGGADNVGTLNMNGGTITANFVAMGWKGTGTLNMTGGTITITTVWVGGGGTGIGHLHLDGGTITTTGLIYAQQGGSGTIDITAGTLIIDGDVTAAIEGYIDDGWLTAYGGAGVLLLDYNITNTGKTTITATCMAGNPNPKNGATDLCPWGVVNLSWTPGLFVGGLSPKHKVFFSEDFDDVNDGVGGVTQDPNHYPPTGTLYLDFGKTYYWRVDEANSTTDWDEGSVWQFATELTVYPITVDKITATASSSDLGTTTGPNNTIDGSGLDGDLHSNIWRDMWTSGLESPSGAWIQYEFDKVYKLHEMWVWNYNAYLDVGPGLKDVTIEYSTDGENWPTLGGVPEFAKGEGAADYAANTTIDFEGVTAKYVRITADENWHTGPIPDLDYYGLSEVRFYAIETAATEPDPESGTAIDGLDVVLSWKQGREAAEHKLYFSTDEQAVIGETIAPDIISAAGCRASYGPLSLDLGQTYYWKVNEVNLAEEPNMWQGDVWNFATPEYFVVDDMESYGEANTPGEPGSRIWYTWKDGLGWTNPSVVPGNGTGSMIGYVDPPHVETVITHGGGQSMPYYYDNSPPDKYSEATASTDDLEIGQDWTEGGAKALSLWFYGDPCNTAVDTDQLYVKVNDARVVYDGDMNDIRQASWHEWNIPLSEFSTNLSNVTEITIGFGIPDAPKSGGSGLVFFDDIRLYPARCILSFRSPDFARVDYVEDCVVDYKELAVMAADWLAVAAAPGTANLVGHWKLDGDASDSSAHNNHGTLYGGPQWVAGKIGSDALDFDGIDDYVDCANDVSLQITGTEITLAVWVKWHTLEAWSGIAGKTAYYTWADGYALWIHNDNTVNFYVAGYELGTASKSFTADDQWHHVAGTYDGSNVRIWVDGVEGTPSSYTGSVTDSASPFEIGRIATADGCTATLDDVRIYNVGLSESEILGLALQTDLYEDLKIDFKDFAILADKWLDEQLFP